MTPRADYSYRDDADVPGFADDRPLIVFDGECVFCSGWVKFALKHALFFDLDPDSDFRPARPEIIRIWARFG